MTPMRVLVIGLGSIGLRHLRNLSALGVTSLAALRTRQGALPTELPSAKVDMYTDWGSALASGIDAVVVANPTSLHLQTARLALEAGCNVYLEKPISHSEEGVEALLQLAKSRDLVIAVGCQLRFHPHFRLVSDWLQSGRLGALYSASAEVGDFLADWHPWEDYRQSYAALREMGGGVVLTLIHEIDYLQKLFGPIGRVYAQGGARTSLSIEAEDTALLSLTGRDGFPIHLRMDFWRKPMKRMLNVVGETGEITWDYAGRSLTFVGRKGELLEQNVLPDGWDKNEMFREAMGDFLDSVRSKREPATNGQEGRDALRVAMGALRSMESHQALAL